MFINLSHLQRFLLRDVGHQVLFRKKTIVGAWLGGKGQGGGRVNNTVSLSLNEYMQTSEKMD